jgi:DNA-directed RNA polymerase alpha subunit
MARIENHQDLGRPSCRYVISGSFPENEFSQFRAYCASCNIFFVDELQPYDYVAFRTQSKADVEFVRKIRTRAEIILSDKAIIASGTDDSKPVTNELESESSPTVSEYHNIPCEMSLKAAADAYMNSPLDGLAIPNRIRHRLLNSGITTIGKMLLTTSEQFLSLGFMGTHSLDAIKSVSEDLVRDYIYQKPILQNAPLVSDFKQEIDKKQVILKQTTENPEKQGSDHQQPADDYDEDNRILALIIASYECIDLPLNILKLSLRTNNRLQHGDFGTVGKVLLATDEQLLCIKQLGRRALQEIREASNIFLQNYIDQNPNWQKKFDKLPPEIQQLANQEITNLDANISGDFRLYLENMLSGNTQSDYKYEFTFKESKIMNRILQAIEVVGIEICKLAYDDPAGTKPVIQGFLSFIDFQDVVQTIQKLFSAIPESRRTKQLPPYIKLFNQVQLLAKGDLSNIFSICNTINDIRDNIYFIAEQENQYQVKNFLEWLSFDILEIVKPILVETVGEGRKEQILSRRAAGETLETISEAFDLTRERIRQIEGKAIQVFTRYRDSYPLLLAISAELNGETIITSDDIRSLIPDSEILLYLLKKLPDNQFKYDKHIDYFYLPTLLDPDSISDFVSDLPKLIYESELEPLLNQLSQNNNIPKKYLDLVFKKHYLQTGTIWHAGKMSRASMYSFIIDKYFPNGFRVYDTDDVGRFRKYVREVFGDIDIPENDHAIESIIYKVCVLCGRGVYISPSRLSIPDDLIDRIEAYFLQSGRTSMAFHELYDKFADELLTQANITNRYSLQGVLKDRLEDKYIFYKDGISTKEGYKITQEIETYIQNNSPVSKETMMAAFSGITEAMLMQNIARLPSVILTDNSTYLHSKRLKLTVGDYSIIKIIKTFTNDYPVTASKLLETLYSTHSDFLFRNNISSPNTLFGILQFMFSDMFSFSRPYISSLNTGNISKREIILSLLEGQDRVNIADLISLCEEHHLSFPSSALMMHALQDDYLRVDKEALVSTTTINVTDEKLNDIKELLSNAICLNGYLAFKSIDNFIFFPDLGFPWTPYLLCSIIEKYFPNDFKIIINASIQDIAFDLIVDPRLETDNYEDLVRSVIRTEHKRDPFKDQPSVVLWLINEGFLAKKAAILKEGPDLFNSNVIRLVNRHIPKFITDSNFMYIDEYGKLIVR